MQPRWRPAERSLRAAALSALLSGVAGAQVCTWPAEIMDVRVGASTRGEWLTRRSPDGQLWIERTALRTAERGYVQEDAPCGDGDGVLIRSGVTWAVDESALQLRLTPNLSFLPTTSSAVQWTSSALQGGQPVATLPVQAEVTGDLTGVTRATLGVRPSLQRGPVLLGGEVNVRADHGAVTVTGALGSRVQLPGATAGVQVRRDAAGYSGAGSVSAGRLTSRTLPPLSIALPLGGELTVQVEGDTSAAIVATAGTLVLTGIPIPNRAGAVTVTIRDEAGVRTERVTFPAPAHAMNDGDWQASASATVDARGVSTQVQGTLVRGAWLWAADGTWTARQAAGAVTATYRDGTRTLGLTTGLRQVQRDIQPRFGVTYQTQGLIRDVTWTAGAHATWSGAPQDRRAGVNLGLSADRWQVRASGDWTPDGVSVTTTGQWQVRPDLQVRAGGRWGPQQSAWQIGITWQVSPVTTAETRLGRDPALTVTVRPDDTFTLQAQVTPAESRVDLTGGGAAQLRASVSTRGTWQASASSVLVLTGGMQRWSRTGDSGVVILHTGMPDLPVQLDGAPAGRTDAQGTLLLPDVTPGARHTLSVRTDDLPIEVTVRDDRLTFTTQGQAGTELDWRANFTRLHAVTFFLRPGQPAAFGTVRSAGQDWSLDDLGRALLPDQSGEGQLLLDGESCPVAWTNTDTTVTCMTRPLP
ncbi:hypothetical protein GCM10010842_20680 [Deinococcus daejeonensis]|uniref:Uncharacterized protein n=1 Tax=Deinococcus daejeonensis TaxID=1007098 RepID=A0ABQ2J3E4_9DEIO|nr:hypothetical protein GCM10010842_20680 [Deinococcus daejeonensis]